MKETIYAKEIWIDEFDNLHVVKHDGEHLIYTEARMLAHKVEVEESEFVKVTEMKFTVVTR